MKNKFLFLMLFFFGLYFNTANCQNAIKEKVQTHIQQIESAQNHQLFDEINAPNLNDRIPNATLSEKQFLNLNQTALQAIQNDQSDFLRLSLNIAGQNATLNLFQANVVTPDFQVVTSSKEPIDVNPGLHYWGTLQNDPNSLVAISIFEDQIMGSIVSTNGSYTIGKVKDSDAHILYKTTDLRMAESFECGVTNALNINEPFNSNNASNARANNCVRIHVEFDYQFYLDFNSDPIAITNYVTGLFSQVAILYANESISIAISYINIWTQPSPYNAGTELADLQAVGYGSTYGNLVHLLHNNSLTGEAYTGFNNGGVLCWPTYNVGHSGVSRFYSNVPTYSNDVGIVTHEIGHNFGSPHTHDCFWNGNNTAIDGCGPAVGDVTACNLEPLPISGTIMSYCNLVLGVEIDFSLGFGQQPGDLIRDNYLNATCLSACSDPVCFSNDLTFNFDTNPGEITWEIISDLTGLVVESGGGYGGLADYSTIIENVCLEEGCYTLVVNDSGNNGLCPTPNPIIFGNPANTGMTGLGNIVYTNYIYTAPALCGNLNITNEFAGLLISQVGNFGQQMSEPFCVLGGDGVPTRLSTNTELEDEIGMTLYPTIANDVVMLSFATEDETSVNLNIYDATGNLIKSMKNQNIQNGQTMQLEVADLPKGSYFIKMSSYKHTNTQRFFKF